MAKYTEQQRLDAAAEADSALDVLGEAGSGTHQRYNEVMRAGAASGVPIIWLLQCDLRDAWVKIMQLEGSTSPSSSSVTEKSRQVRARARGLAQGLALVQNPFTRQDLGGDSGEWMKLVLEVEREAQGRARATIRKADRQ